MNTLLDEPGRDTWLARRLHDQGVLPVDVLQAELWEARRCGTPLARRLVERGLLDEATTLAALGAARPETIAPPGSARPPDAAPHGLGDYELLEELGSGGMGRVYRARHRRSGAVRALKTLLPTLDDELRVRFEREGEAQAAIPSHPNVARVHSAGSCAGRLFLALELVEGGSLADRLREGPLPPDEAAALVAALADGLQHAHDHGVLHRDLKPANVLLTPEGEPKLVDFGLARVAWAGSLTESGAIMGTPAYMPPEQVESTRDVDARGDVYALGAVLYACLTGEPPFGGASTLETLRRVIEEPPRSPRSLNPDLPAWLEAVCLRALAKRPDDRYPSAAALGEALEAGEGSGGPRRGRALAVAAALTALAALVARAALPAQSPLPDATTSVAPVPPSDAAPAAPAETPPRELARRAVRLGDWSALARLSAADPWVARLQAAGRVLTGKPPGDAPPGAGELITAAGIARRLRDRLEQAGAPTAPGSRAEFDDPTRAPEYREAVRVAVREWSALAQRTPPEAQPELAAIGARFLVAGVETLVASAWFALRRQSEKLKATRDLEQDLERIRQVVAPREDLGPVQDYMVYMRGDREALRALRSEVRPLADALPELRAFALLPRYLAGEFHLTEPRREEGERLRRTVRPSHATHHGWLEFLLVHARITWRLACHRALGKGRVDRDLLDAAHDMMSAYMKTRTDNLVLRELVMCDLARRELDHAKQHLDAVREPRDHKLLRAEYYLVSGNRLRGARIANRWRTDARPIEAVAQRASCQRTLAEATQFFADYPATTSYRLDIPWRTRTHTLAIFDGAWWPGRDP